jgi:hypothetical protein
MPIDAIMFVRFLIIQPKEGLTIMMISSIQDKHEGRLNHKFQVYPEIKHNF